MDEPNQRPAPAGVAARADPGDPADPADPAVLRAVAERVVVEAVEHLRSVPRPWEDRSTGPDGPPPGVATKSTPLDVVTAADTALETLVRGRLTQLRPGEPVVGEETGGAAAPGAVTWVVDPIDGTVNFLYGLPWYAVSVAATRDGVGLAGVVAEPATGRVWSAARGAGATCDGRPLRAAAATDLAFALVGTGYAYALPRRARQTALVAGLLPRVRDVRCLGSAALETCSVAAARLDAYVEHGTNWWDWAAAALIAAEAGAVVRTPAPPGREPPDDGLGPDTLLVAAPGIADHLAALLRELGAAGI